jgi:AAA ATPase domain
MAGDRPRYDVDVSGGKVGAVGDYATVFQIFTDSAPELTSYIRVAQFRALVDDRTDGFVGRDFIFNRIDELLAGAEFDAGYVVILGEPGIGKSAIAATLVARRGYVHHFNIAPENIRTARQFLESVCAQLIIRYELDHSSLPPDAGEDAGFLSQLLAEAAAKRGDQPIVVVVDALDEAEDTGLSPSANRLFLPRALPSGVFFVLTSRDEYDYRLDVAEAEEIWIRDDDPENARDVTRFIEAFVDQHADEMIMRITEWGVERDKFVREIATLSEGNFMYLVYVLRDIARGRLTKDTVGAIDALPRGLKRYYLRHWRDMKAANPNRFTTYQRPVLCFLAISREPVTVDQLAQWTQLEPGDVTSVIQEWREFLNPDGDRYRIYHRSFAEFLDEEENLRYYHEQIVQSALAKIPGFPGTPG